MAGISLAWDGLYAVLMSFAQPLLPLYLRSRTRRGKEDPGRLSERYGLSATIRPPGRLVWLHGASVGETLSALPLLERLLTLNPDLTMLVTSGTRTSADLLARRLPPRALHQYVPLDVPAYAARFLDHWQPDAALWLESELWPGLLRAMRERRIPAARLNARLSERSARAWSRCKGWLRHLNGSFQLILAISETDRQRLLAHSPLPVFHAGNLKLTVSPPPADSAALAELKHHIGTRPVWLMASSHAGEEELARNAHSVLQRHWPDLLTVIVPRHPARADDIEMMLGGAVPRRSRSEWPQPGHPFYLGDSLGEMGLYYRASPIACVGGSFAPKGGHNPLEAVQCGCAALIGPDTEKCQDIVDELIAAEALLQVRNGTELTARLADLLDNTENRRALQQAGKRTGARQAEIMAETLDRLAGMLSPLGIRST